jgi:hypothetical protein
VNYVIAGLVVAILLVIHLIWIEVKKLRAVENRMITDKRRLLKIKLKSLAEESRIIRREELRLRALRHSALREEIYLHRVHDVRNEARATLLAYAFIRGKTYLSVEHCRLPSRDWAGIVLRAATMVGKYGTPEMKKEAVDLVKNWVAKTQWPQEGQAAA